jgi:hypothetical protein
MGKLQASVKDQVKYNHGAEFTYYQALSANLENINKINILEKSLPIVCELFYLRARWTIISL